MRTLIVLIVGTLVAAALLIVSLQGSAIATQLDDLNQRVQVLVDAPATRDYCDGYRQAWFDSGEPYLNWQSVDGCSGR